MENGTDRTRAERAGEEREVAAVLSHATRPELPEGAMSRLMERIAATPQEEAQEAKVLVLPPPAARRRPGLFRLAAALPLAASLALGIYLGAKGSLDFMLPSIVTGGVALNDDLPDDLGGLGEADAYAEENLT